MSLGLVVGARAGVSALVGGACCVVPNFLFGVRLLLAMAKPEGAAAGTVLTGEFVKVGLTVLLLSVAVLNMRDMQWWGFLAGFVITLKSALIALLWRPRSPIFKD